VIELADVQAAARRLEGVAHRTPVLTSRTLDARAGGAVALKAENLQRGGAFKFRGAYNHISSLDDGERARGVVTASSGNHAQAVALAAGLCGTSALVLMPDDAPAAKREATEGYGAQIVGFDRYAADREALLRATAAETGRVIVHAYDDPLVMAGQGTVGLELLEDAGPLDLLVVPVGGGGLISGCAVAARGVAPGTRVIGVEPEAGDDTRRSLAEGRRVTIPVPRTIADGQQLVTPGELTFEVVREAVDEVVTATDAEIVDAMVFLFERCKLVAEPSGACALAGLLSGRIGGGWKRAGVVISGGNVGRERFAELLGGVAIAEGG
jgi:threo-3-hydroxy-L-aspartate ammonia-lyase